MTPQEIDQTIRNLAAYSEDIEHSEWVFAEELNKLSPMEYEQNLPRIITATHRSRQWLTMRRHVAAQWTPKKRFPNVPFAIHQQFVNHPEELRRQVRTGTLGQPRPTLRRQVWTITRMTRAITAILDLDDSQSSYEERWHKTMDILRIFCKTSKAA